MRSSIMKLTIQHRCKHPFLSNINFVFLKTRYSVEPHARWAHGFLLDNSTVPVSYMNRNIRMGSSPCEMD